MAHSEQEPSVATKIWNDLEVEAGTPEQPGALSILFATDGSDEAAKAEQLLKTLPLAPGTTIHVLTVTAGAEWTMPEWFVAGEHAWARGAAERSAEALRRPGVATTAATHSGAIAYEVIEAAKELDADLIVIGSKGLTGLAGFFLGSVARNVAKHARGSVAVARALRNDLQQVVLGVDSSTHSEQAVDFVARLPLPEGATVHVLHVVPAYQPYALVAPEFIVEYEEAVRVAKEKDAADAGALTQAICERLKTAGKNAEPRVVSGDPADEILKLTEQVGADLVVAGARGISVIEGLLVGSVADRILKQAKCSVLLVR